MLINIDLTFVTIFPRSLLSSMNINMHYELQRTLNTIVLFTQSKRGSELLRAYFVQAIRKQNFHP